MPSKTLILLLILVTAGWYWTNERPASQFRADLAASESPYGFVSVPMDRNAPRDAVLIVSALNCPSGGTQRAQALVDGLREAPEGGVRG